MANKTKIDMKLELIAVPVSDIDRAKDFYVDQVGFNDDHDHRFSEEIRFVQLTPPGSGCSISLTTGAHEMEPGSLDGLQLVVEDADAAHDELAERGVEVSDVTGHAVGPFRLLQRSGRQRLERSAGRLSRQAAAVALRVERLLAPLLLALLGGGGALVLLLAFLLGVGAGVGRGGGGGGTSRMCQPEAADAVVRRSPLSRGRPSPSLITHALPTK